MAFTTAQPASLDIMRGRSSHHPPRFTGAAGSDPKPARAMAEKSVTPVYSVYGLYGHTRPFSPIPKGTTGGTCTSPDFLKLSNIPIQTIQELVSEGWWIEASAVMVVLVLVRRKIARGSD